MYCGSGLKKDLIIVVVVVLVVLVLVILHLSNFTVFDRFEGKLIGLNELNVFSKRVKIFPTPGKYNSQ